jgi:glycosyltransferase involved in cell wall biosynthesis
MEHIWIADSAADFATAVVYLLSDQATRDRLSQSAWQLVQQYAWPVIEEQLLATLENHQSARSR